MLRCALLCSLLLLLCATPEAVRLSLRTHTRHRRSALAARMLDAPAGSEDLVPAAKPNSFSSSELKSIMPTKTVPRGVTAPGSTVASSSSPTPAAGSSIPQGRSLRQDPTIGPVVVPPITPMVNQFNDMTITHERDTHASLPSPAASGQTAAQPAAAAQSTSSANAVPSGRNSESSAPKMNAGQTPIASIAKPLAVQPPAPVNQRSPSPPAGQPSGAAVAGKMEKSAVPPPTAKANSAPQSAAQPAATGQSAAAPTLDVPTNAQSFEKPPGIAAQSAAQPTPTGLVSNAVPSAAAPAAKSSQFNDMTIHERDTHAIAASPAQSAASTNQFNDLTITHERDNHAEDATPAKLERDAQREVRRMTEKMEVQSLHELAAEFAAKHLSEDAEDADSLADNEESSERSGGDLIADAALPDGPDAESVDDEDAETTEDAEEEEDADEASEDERTGEEEEEESARTMAADADAVSPHSPRRKVAQIGDRPSQPTKQGSSALRVDADHDGFSLTPYNDMTIAEAGTK